MKSLFRRLFLLFMLVPVLLWTTIYEMVVGFPKHLYAAWKHEIDTMQKEW